MIGNKQKRLHRNGSDLLTGLDRKSTANGRCTLTATEFFQHFKVFESLGVEEIIYPLENLIKVEELDPMEHMNLVEMFEKMYGAKPEKNDA